MPDSDENKLLISIHSIEFMAPYPLETAEACLKQPPLLALLAAIEANCAVTAENDYQFQLKWGAYCTRTMIISSALLLLLGLPAIGFGAAVMAEKMDWLELPE